ncbi:MAG: slipin family protein [Treponema sp.]|jgi:regulator of protease activity HflC (stomatin/prohibitin superfamily)|nr:slipin family protein [Treponema sp.]
MKVLNKTGVVPRAVLENRPLIKNLSRSKMNRDYTLPVLRLILLVLAGAMLWALRSALAGWVSPEAGWGIAGAIFFLVLLLVSSIRKIDEWDRGIILRFGQFRKVREAGLFFLLPLADRVAQTVDIRIRVTDFSAQETLTRDSVTVTVDALCFWLVWDPQKAVLEVEDYEDAVVLASKTALRNSVSSHDLSTFLERGDLIEKQIQAEVDKKTTEWGITVQYIEITDVQIPEELQDSISRVAQAEREKKGRILLAEAEIEIAKKLEEATAIYTRNEPAMKLKILSILNEGLKAGNSMMLVPNSMAEELKTNDIFGLEALTELRQKHDKE